MSRIFIPQQSIIAAEIEITVSASPYDRPSALLESLPRDYKRDEFFLLTRSDTACFFETFEKIHFSDISNIDKGTSCSFCLIL